MTAPRTWLVLGPVIATTVAVRPARPDPRLVLTHEPPPRDLRMRTRAAVAAATPAKPAAAKPAANTPPPPPAAVDRIAPPPEQVTALRDVRQPVSFTIDLGYQLDGARLSVRPSLDGKQPVSGRDFSTLRSYGFGEAFLSTRGVGLASLSSYLAVRMQAARTKTTTILDAMNNPLRVPVAPPIATWFERSGVELRYGWAEAKDFLPRSWGLSKLRLRGGSQHIYGPWIVHLDGGLLAYDGPVVSASIYGGVRHSEYTRDQPDVRPSVVGASGRFDLRGLSAKVPIAVQAEYLRHGATSSPAPQPASESTLFQADWRPRSDIAVIAQLRRLNEHNASQRIEVRTRFREVTNIVFDVTRRTQFDWLWDPSLIVPDPDPSAARRYLDLGPVLPQLLGSVRAGTLIAENVDLYARAAGSTDLSDEADPTTRSTFSAPYSELGGGFEVRLRRTIAFGSSVLVRSIDRIPMDNKIVDVAGAQPLPTSAAQGEDGFTELGASIKVTLGARRFSALAEAYGRRTRFDKIYYPAVTPDSPRDELLISDIRAGGRFTIDAWVGDRVRLFGTFEASSQLDTAPEILGYKSLRLMMSGVY
ncbi:MAG: hypothetical protein AB7O24_17860 [Kofleriaceae bacterium]